MRNLICLLLLLLFVGTHIVPGKAVAFGNRAIEEADSVSFLSGFTGIDTGYVLTERQKCCGGDDAVSTSSGNAPCSSDCSFMNSVFEPVFNFGTGAPSHEPDFSLNAAFRHALFRPPIA